jgi:hypothetical protein
MNWHQWFRSGKAKAKGVRRKELDSKEWMQLTRGKVLNLV